MAFVILAQTFTSGVRTGLTQITTECRRNEILGGRNLRRANRDSQRDVRREVVRGGTSLRCRVAPRGQAFLLTFSTPITDFVLPASHQLNKWIFAAECFLMNTLCDVQPPQNFLRDILPVGLEKDL